MTIATQLAAERYLRSRRIHFEIVAHESTDTALSEAAAVAIPPRYVLKSVVLHTPQGFALAIVPASRMLDMHLLREAVGIHDIRLATETEIATAFPGYELGAIPPLPDLLGIPGYVDPIVIEQDEVAFADGRRTESMIAGPREMFWGQRVFVEPISRPVNWRIEGDAVDFG